MRQQKTRAHRAGLPTDDPIVHDAILGQFDALEAELSTLRACVEKRLAAPEPTLISIPDAAERLGLSTTSLRSLLRRRDVDVEVINLGERKQRIRVSDLERLQREGLRR